jgi:L-ascorbate metabolism protein UlaG (beta-lactamase superfamily)
MIDRRLTRTAAYVLCGVALLGAAQRPPALEARFIGNMAFAISDGALTIATDFPYRSGYSGYMTYSSAELQALNRSILALITHRHADHWERDLFAGTDWKIIAPPDATRGLDDARVVPLSSPITFGPVRVEPIRTPHANVDHYSYVVTWHGRRLYFSGDTESPDHLRVVKDLDVAFMSPWLDRSVLRGGLTLNAKRIVIYHHTAGERVPECGRGCTLPRQGERLPL